MFREFYDDPFFGINEYDHRGRLVNELEKKKKVKHSHQSLVSPNEISDMAIRDPFDHSFMNGSGMLSNFSSSDAFSIFDSMMPRMGNLRNGIELFSSGNSQQGFGFSSMKVSTYVDDGSGQPQVFEAVKSTKVAPGGLKETKKALRDTTVGIEKMSLGRHIKDRGHVMTREKNTKTGHMNENQDYLGFAEEEAGQFDEEWMNKIGKYTGQLNSEKGKKYLKNERLA